MPELKETVKVLSYLAALYPHYELTEATIDAYQDQLQSLDKTILKAAARLLGGTSKFFPAAAELRKAATDIQYRVLSRRWYLLCSETDNDDERAQFLNTFGRILFGRRDCDRLLAIDEVISNLEQWAQLPRPEDT